MEKVTRKQLATEIMQLRYTTTYCNDYGYNYTCGISKEPEQAFCEQQAEEMLKSRPYLSKASLLGLLAEENERFFMRLHNI